MLDLGLIPFYEIKWMVLGSKMSAGATLFRDIWDNTAPLSAGFYWILDMLFGRSHFVYYFVALILTIYQAALFNSLVIGNNAMQENTYIPALFYALLFSLTEEFMILSPLLIGLTFFLLALNNIFGQIQIRAKRDEKIMIIGIYMGVATMCHFVFGVLFIGVVLVLLIFSGTVLRRYLLMITGFLIPVILVLLYYLIVGGLQELFIYGMASALMLEVDWHLNKWVIISICGFPAILLLLSFWKIAQRSRLSNYQARLLQVMILFLVIGFSCFWAFSDRSMLPLLLICPSVVYLLTQYFLILRKSLLNEIAFFTCTVVLALTPYVFHYGWFGSEELMKGNTLLVPDSSTELTDGKELLVLGADWQILRRARHVTPFYNWKVSSQLFRELDYYDNQSIILEQMKQVAPELIVDRENLYPKLRARFPLLQNNYVEVSGAREIYQKKESP